jgi:hypothetical protein
MPVTTGIFVDFEFDQHHGSHSPSEMWRYFVALALCWYLWIIWASLPYFARWQSSARMGNDCVLFLCLADCNLICLEAWYLLYYFKLYAILPGDVRVDQNEECWRRQTEQTRDSGEILIIRDAQWNGTPCNKWRVFPPVSRFFSQSW